MWKVSDRPRNCPNIPGSDTHPKLYLHIGHRPLSRPFTTWMRLIQRWWPRKSAFDCIQLSPRRFSCAINSTKLLITIYFKKSCNGNRFALLCRLVLGEIRRHFGRSFAYRDNNRERYSFSPPGRSKSSAPVKFSGVITTAQRKYIICIFNIMFLFAFYMIDMSVKVCNFRISRSPNWGPPLAAITGQ